MAVFTHNIHLVMKFENYGSPLLGYKLEATHITWRD